MARSILADLTVDDIHDLTTCPTTRLTTRAAAVLWLERTMAPTWGAVMVDLDGLKRVNDAAGHDAGDALLRLAAEVVRCTVRHDDVLVVRWGGDELLVLAPGAASVTPILDRLTLALDGRFAVRASVGGAVAERVADAITAADLGMMATKSARRVQR